MVKVFVGNLSGSSVTERDLQTCFEQIGPVTDCVVMQSGGFGFVHMESKEDASRAISELNGTELCGAKLSVEMSRPRRGDGEDIKIFIGNLDKDKVSGADLESAFAKYGTVTEAAVVDKYGFVHMNSRDDAKIAIGRLNKSNLNGCIIDVQQSTGENRRGGGGGGRDRGRRDERRGDDRGRRDPYYDDYYYRDAYSRRAPPPEPYYRERYDPRDEYRRRLPPPPPRRADPYYDDFYPPPRSDSYRYPPPRDYADYPPPSYERDVILPRRESGSRGRYGPPSARREQEAPEYESAYPPRRDSYPPPARPEYSDDMFTARHAPRASVSARKSENFAEDSYSSLPRSGSSSGLYPYSGTEYPGEKRPVPSGSLSSSTGYQYASGGAPPAKRSAYGGGSSSDLMGSYGY